MVTTILIIVNFVLSVLLYMRSLRLLLAYAVMLLLVIFVMEVRNG